MKNRPKHRLERYMVRPFVYMAFIRIVLGLTASLLLDHFLAGPSGLPMRAYAFLFVGVFLLVMAWMAYLRLDGVKLPAFDKRLFEWKRKPQRSYGDIIDYVDEDVISFDDLEDNEKDICRFLSDLLCGVVFCLIPLI